MHLFTWKSYSKSIPLQKSNASTKAESLKLDIISAHYLNFQENYLFAHKIRTAGSYATLQTDQL